MIKGDTYCKNCYMRIFKEKGKYSSFGDKTLPARERGASSLASEAPSTLPVHVNGDSSLLSENHSTTDVLATPSN